MLRRKFSRIVLALLLVDTLVFTTNSFMRESAASDGGSVDWWPMFRHYANHTGYSTSNVPAPLISMAPPTPFSTGKAVKSSPAIADDVIYACSLDGYVYTLLAKPPYMPVPKWRSPKQFGPIWSSPAVVDGKVYFGSDDGNITALDASNGAWVWSYTTKGAVRSSPIITDGVLYVGSYDGYVYALNATTGSEIWRFRVASPVESSPAVFGGIIFFGSNDSRIYALETSGKIKWFNITGGPITSSPCVANGKVFVGSWDNRTYAFDVSTGNQIWNYTTGGPVCSSPSVAYGRVFVGSNDTRVYALDSETGQFNWSFVTGKPVTSSPAVADGRVFVGSADKNVYSINATTGSDTGWNCTTGESVASSPAIAHGILSIGSDDGNIYAFTGNRTPMANFTFYPEEPIVTQLVTFDGSQSYDPDNATGDYIDKWEFDFGDGTTVNGSQTLTTVTHAYCTAGEYNVILTVWDTKGENTNASQLLTVCEAWPMFHHDPSHTGYSSSQAPINNRTLWTQEVGEPVSEDLMYPSPAVAGDTVFMSSMNLTKGAVYALFTNGTMRWNVTNLPDKIHSSPLVVDDRAYVGCDDGKVYVFDANLGLIRNLSITDNRIRSSPTTNGSCIFVGADDGYVYCINKATYSVSKSDYLGGTVFASPAIAERKIFVATSNGIISVLNEALNITNQITVSGGIRSSPTIANGTIFIGSQDHHVYAFDTATLNQKWNHTTNGVVDSSPAVADGIVFVGSKDGNMYALNATTGKEIWNKSLDIIRWSSPAIADGKVFIGSENKKIYALSNADGSEVWSFQTDGAVESSPAVLNDTLYVGSQDGYLYAFHSEIHDVAILNVASAPTTVIQGGIVNVTVTLKNEGAFDETGINVTVSYESNVFDYNITNLNREKQKTLSFSWNTTGIPYGSYTINANAALAVDDVPTNNNWTDGVINITSSVRNIAVTYVNTSKTDCLPMPVICGNYSARVFVIVENRGNSTETLNVTAHVTNDTNTFIIEELEVTLNPGENTTLTFVWSASGFAKGNYTIWAYAWPVPDEADTTDNIHTDGVVAVVMDGDVNGDGKVEIKDVYAVGKAYGTSPEGPNPPGREYNPNCDINDDNEIDVKDYYQVQRHYGEEDP